MFSMPGGKDMYRERDFGGSRGLGSAHHDMKLDILSFQGVLNFPFDFFIDILSFCGVRLISLILHERSGPISVSDLDGKCSLPAHGCTPPIAGWFGGTVITVSLITVLLYLKPPPRPK